MTKEVINSKTNYINIIRLNTILESLLERTDILESKRDDDQIITTMYNSKSVRDLAKLLQRGEK